MPADAFFCTSCGLNLQKMGSDETAPTDLPEGQAQILSGSGAPINEETESDTPKKAWPFFVGAVLIVLLGFAAFVLNTTNRGTTIEPFDSETADTLVSEGESDSDGTEALADQSESTEEVDPYALYADVLDMIYRNYNNGWSELDDRGQTDVLDPDSVSDELYSWNEYDLDSMGYAFIDLDENGIPELLIAPVDPYYAGAVFDIYSVDDNGTILHLASGSARLRYYLCDDLSLRFEGSGGASLGYDIRYRLDETEHMLLSTDTLIYDGLEDENNPYYLYTDEPRSPDDDGGYDYSTMVHLSAEDWQDMLDEWTTTYIDVTPFRRYESSANSGQAEEEDSDLAVFQRFVSNFDESDIAEYTSCRYMLYDCNNDGRDELMVVYAVDGYTDRVVETTWDVVSEFASYGCADFYTVNDSGKVELLYRTPAHVLAGTGDFNVIEVEYHGEMHLAYYQYISEDWDHDVYELLSLEGDTLVEGGTISVYFDGSTNYRVLADIWSDDTWSDSSDEAMSKTEFIR
jgi:hypothetical protein